MKRFLLLFIAALCLIGNPASGINIIPQPTVVKEKSGEFLFSGNTTIGYKGNIEGVDDVISIFSDEQHELNGLNLSLTSSQKPNILLRDKSSLGRESYELEVSGKQIVLRASSIPGYYYGLQTLRQLIEKRNNKPFVGAVHIADKPRFSYRGFLVDVGRNYLPPQDIKKIIDIASKYKLNYFHWHLTDDQGWRVEIKKYPLLTQLGSSRPSSSIGTWDQFYPPHYDGVEHKGYYTQEELKDIVKFAQQRQVTIVPEIEMPGHSSAAISAYPDLACSFHKSFGVMKDKKISDMIMCPKPYTFNFIRDVLSEISEIFPGPYIHIGADECPKTSWEKCQDCQSLIKEQHLKDETQLHAYFVQRVEEIAKKLKKKIIGWDEILEGGLPLTSIVMSWHGVSTGVKAAHLGNDVIMCPTSYCYLDYYQENPEFAPLAIGGFIPLDSVYAFDPMPKELTRQETRHILGVQGNIWGEYVSTLDKYEYMAYPRLLAIAEIGWTQSNGKDIDRFHENVKKEFAYFDQKKVNACREFFRPQVKGEWNDPSNSYQVALSSICPNTRIRYTLDGSEPTSDSRLYESPIAIDKNTTVKAILVSEDNKILGSPTVKSFVVNKATGCSYSLQKGAWSLDWYAVKPSLFTDGRLGFAPSNYEWAAIASGEEIVIDLRKSTSVNRIKMGTMRAPVNSVMPLDSVTCYLSEDGKSYKEIGRSSFSYPPYYGEKQIFRDCVKTNGATGRYLKIQFWGQTQTPSWYPYQNSLPNIALDEIEVN